MAERSTAKPGQPGTDKIFAQLSIEKRKKLVMPMEPPPLKVECRRPTEGENAVTRIQKARMESFAEIPPPDQLRLFATSKREDDLKGKQKRGEQKGKKLAKKSIPRPAGGPSSICGMEGSVGYLCVLDFEATCDDKKPAPRPQEIIEFPTLLVNVRTGKVEREFHHYVKPDVNPTLTPFCTSLTGITQSMVNEGDTLDHVLALHREWLDEVGLIPAFTAEAAERLRLPSDEKDPPTFLYLTCGDWDLKTCLPAQLRYHSKNVPAIFNDWINLKHDFRHVYGKKAGGMTGMLKELGMELRGRHHSGIDDCRNIARICERMLEDGWIPGSAARNKRLQNVWTPPEAFVKACASKEKVLVGIVGTSRGGLVDKAVARKAVNSALDQVVSSVASDSREPVIVSGGGVVPNLAFQWAAESGYSAKQVVSASVRSKPKNVERIVFGKRHGDESKEFIKMIDVFVRVGGGPQSYEELRCFRRSHPDGLVVEKELPLVSAGDS